MSNAQKSFAISNLKSAVTQDRLSTHLKSLYNSPVKTGKIMKKSNSEQAVKQRNDSCGS